jgi:hypothetical protein
VGEKGEKNFLLSARKMGEKTPLIGTLCVCVCVCIVLEFELRASHLQSRHSPAWATLPVHFLLWLFWRWRSHKYLPGLARTFNCLSASNVLSDFKHLEKKNFILSRFNTSKTSQYDRYFTKGRCLKKSLLSKLIMIDRKMSDRDFWQSKNINLDK